MGNAPIEYMERTRLYYRALGYEQDYLWAQHRDVPFARLGKPVSEARLALITSANQPGPWSEGKPPKRQIWSGKIATAPQSLYTQDLAWDKDSTHMRDRESYLPITALTRLVERGLLGGLTENFHGVPTTYSQRLTTETNAPEILHRVEAGHADAALLVPI
jgi:D-proline reductase (dithiol) PrdB